MTGEMQEHMVRDENTGYEKEKQIILRLTIFEPAAK